MNMILDDPFSTSEYSTMGRTHSKKRRLLNKGKQTQSVDTLKSTKVNMAEMNWNSNASVLRLTKKPLCGLKLKPVQPRKKQRISSRDLFEVFGSMGHVTQDEISRLASLRNRDTRDSKMVSPQLSYRQLNGLLSSVEADPFQRTEHRENMPNGCIFTPPAKLEQGHLEIDRKMRETNSAFKAMDSYPQRGNHQESSNKFIKRMSILKSDEASSRVSTMDTNTLSKQSQGYAEESDLGYQCDENFLKHSHRRTKQNSGRYFKDERVSLPQIKSINFANKKMPFGVKRVSCTKNIQNCFGETSCMKDSNQFKEACKMTDRATENYFHQPKQMEAMISLPQDSCPIDSNRIPSRRRNRNYSNSKSSLKGLSNMMKSFQNKGGLFTNRLQDKHFSNEYLKTVDAKDTEEMNELNTTPIFSSPQRERRYEKPATPSFAST